MPDAGLIIVGAGGFGREVLQYARDCHRAGRGPQPVGFLDDGEDPLAGYHVGVPLLGTPDDHEPREHHVYVIAVGDPGRRRDLSARIRARGGDLTSVVHPTAFIADTARIAEGCVVAPFAFLAVDSAVEANVAINAYACVGHDCVVGAHSVMSPYSTLNGYAELEQSCLLGTHASVATGVTVGRNSKVASGSVVLADVPAGSLVVGTPGVARAKYPVA